MGPEIDESANLYCPQSYGPFKLFDLDTYTFQFTKRQSNQDYLKQGMQLIQHIEMKL